MSETKSLTKLHDQADMIIGIYRKPDECPSTQLVVLKDRHGEVPRDITFVEVLAITSNGGR